MRADLHCGGGGCSIERKWRGYYLAVAGAQIGDGAAPRGTTRGVA
jgi:hypothetical protein